MWAEVAAIAGTAPLLQSTSEAFAALVCEQTALACYQPSTKDEEQPLLMVTHALDETITQLEQARTHWQYTKSLLAQVCEQPPDKDHKAQPFSLLLYVLEQQTRLAVLLACLASEQESRTRRVVRRMSAASCTQQSRQGEA